jgi:Ca2+/Na+ antiporter
MKNNYKIHYVACVFSALAAIYCAAYGTLGWLILNLFFVAYNWYVAKWLKEKQEKEDKDNDDRDL